MTDKLEIPCPECNCIKRIPVDHLRRNPTFFCSKCGKLVTVDSLKFVRAYDKALDDIASMFER